MTETITSLRQEPAIVKDMDVSYKLGFSDSLNPNSISAYRDMVRYQFEGDNSRVLKLHARYKHGYMDGLRIKREVRTEEIRRMV